MSVDAKFIRDIDQYFKYPSDENPTTQQAYQEAVRNWVGTEEAIVDSHLWQPTTNYSGGNQVKTPSLPPQCVLVCTTAGTSGNSEPDYTNVDVGDSVTDGTVTWLVSEAIVGGDFVKTHAYGISTDKTFLNFFLNTSNPESAVESMQLNSGGLNICGKALNNASNVFLNGTGNIYGYKTNGAFTLYCGSDNVNPSMTLWGVNSSSNAGYFRLRSTLDGSNNKDLVGRPDGTLTWGGLNISPQKLITTAFDEKNIATGTRTSLGTFTLTKGTWIIVASASFASNSTGYRYLGISDTATGNQLSRFHSVSCAAASGIATHIIFTTIHGVSDTTTLHLTVHQTSGSTLATTNNGVRLFRISHDA